MDRPNDELTHALAGLDAGRGPAAAAELMPLVYDELRRIAGRYIAAERGPITLQPTAVVNEAYLRLVDQTRVGWRGRTHFLAVGAVMLRRILVDHARNRMRIKRGAEWQRVTVDGSADPAGAGPIEIEQLIDLDAALAKLADLDPRQAEIVELRYFAGLSNEEVARHLGVSLRTVVGSWSHARAWLRRELQAGGVR